MRLFIKEMLSTVTAEVRIGRDSWKGIVSDKREVLVFFIGWLKCIIHERLDVTYKAAAD